MLIYLRLVLWTLRRAARARGDLLLENLALRQQLAMFERHPTIRDGDRAFWSLLAGRWPSWRGAVVVVSPETIVRWHRAGWRRYWRWRSRGRRAGRPRIPEEARELIAQMSQENRCWGARRIQAELRALGYEVSAETVRRYRLQARRRPPSQRWQAFLANHRNEIWAADFFTVPTVLFQTLYVLFFISHDRRRIEHINVTAHPNAAWVWRQVIEATPWGRGPRFLIRDRDRSYGGDFIAKARAIGIETVLTPIRAPQANGIAERLIGTLRRDCTNHIIPLSERHLRRVLLEYVAYYNATRPHQTLGQETPEGPREVRLAGMVRGEEVLGGLHHRYERVAA